MVPGGMDSVTSGAQSCDQEQGDRRDVEWQGGRQESRGSINPYRGRKDRGVAPGDRNNVPGAGLGHLYLLQTSPLEDLGDAALAQGPGLLQGLDLVPDPDGSGGDPAREDLAKVVVFLKHLRSVEAGGIRRDPGRRTTRPKTPNKRLELMPTVGDGLPMAHRDKHAEWLGLVAARRRHVAEDGIQEGLHRRVRRLFALHGQWGAAEIVMGCSPPFQSRVHGRSLLAG